MTSSNPLNAKKMGFVGGKVPCPYGPSAGDAGLRKNVEFFKNWREKVGDDFPLMLDCYMSHTVPYTIKLANALKPYNPKWIEEFLPPDNYSGYSDVKRALNDSGTSIEDSRYSEVREKYHYILEHKFENHDITIRNSFSKILEQVQCLQQENTSTRDMDFVNFWRNAVQILFSLILRGLVE